MHRGYFEKFAIRNVRTLFVNSYAGILFLIIVPISSFSQQDSLSKEEQKEFKIYQKYNKKQPPLNAQQIAAAEGAKLPTIKGDTLRIADLKGKVVILDFWATWCGPCKRMMPTLQRLLDEYPNDLVVVPVSIMENESLESVKAFAAAKPYKFIYTYSAGLYALMNIEVVPFKIFIGPDGKFISKTHGTAGDKMNYKEIKELIEKNKLKK